MKFKKLFIIAALVGTIILLPACNKQHLNTEVPKGYMTGVCTKNDVDEFLDILEQSEYGLMYQGYPLTKSFCYNITSETVFEETGARIFKFSNSCLSLCLLDGRIYPLGENFGGYGLINAVPCDFDNDGNTDILYTYSWGSGLHRSCVAVFNTQTKESEVIFNTIDTDNSQIDLWIERQSQNNETENIHFDYVVYQIKIDMNNSDNNFADLKYVCTDVIGSVVSVDNSPVFYTNYH